MRTEEIRNAVKAEFEEHSYYVRKDIDAMFEGWNPMECIDDSRVVEHVIKELGIDADDDEEISEVYDAAMEILEEIYEDVMEALNEDE